MKPSKKKIIKVGTTLLAVLILVSAFLAYGRYSEVKQAVIAQISGKATELIDQRVNIGDISFITPSGISLYDITIENPEGFETGHLLTIERLFLGTKLGELLRGDLYFRNITVYSPVLTVTIDHKGRINVSEKLRLLSKKETALSYFIREFSIISGTAGYNGDERYRTDNINLTLENVSSAGGNRSVMKADASWGGNIIGIEGWAYLRDEPRQFHISVESRDFRFSPFKELFDSYRVDSERIKADLNVTAEGNADRGFSLRSRMLVAVGEHAFLKEDSIDLHIETDAFINIQDRLITVNDIVLKDGAGSSVRLKGEIDDIFESPHYTAECRIDTIDLSAVGFIKGFELGGIITSDTIRIRGGVDDPVRDIAGSLSVKDASLSSDMTDIQRINVKMTFSSDRERSADVRVSAKILQIGEHMIVQPADIDLSIQMRGEPGEMVVSSRVSLFPVEMHIGNKRDAILKHMTLLIEGALGKDTFSGRSTIKTEGFRYAGYGIQSLTGSFGVQYGTGVVGIQDITVNTDETVTSVNLIEIKKLEKGGRFLIRMDDLAIAHPGKMTELKNIDVGMNLERGERTVSGDFVFSAGPVIFQDSTYGTIAGSGRFDAEQFSVALTRADFFGGSLELHVSGRNVRSPFPIAVQFTSEQNDLDGISRIISALSKIPYRMSGMVEEASFEGTLESFESLHGKAVLHARNISIVNTDMQRHLLKNASLHTEIFFEGDTLRGQLDAVSGTIRSSVSGMVKAFMKKGRMFHGKVVIPPVNVNDIRGAFWDIFPDNLLYTGLDGSIAVNVLLGYEEGGVTVKGTLQLKDIVFEEEFGKYSFGPVNGIIPVAYSTAARSEEEVKLPVPDRSQFETAKEFYTQRGMTDAFKKIQIKSFRYGFRIIDDIEIWLIQKGSILQIERLSGSIFGGKLYGSAVINLTGKTNYRAGFLLDGLSLTELCDRVEPINGFLSGKVNGLAQVKGLGKDLSNLIGKAEFWSYRDHDEKTLMSRDFLEKIGGPSVKTYLGDREFDKGIMSLSIQKGLLIFNELEISNRNFIGMQDLSIKVAPFNNRIDLDHFMWTIVEAAQRAKKKESIE